MRYRHYDSTGGPLSWRLESGRQRNSCLEHDYEVSLPLLGEEKDDIQTDVHGHPSQGRLIHGPNWDANESVVNKESFSTVKRFQPGLQLIPKTLENQVCKFLWKNDPFK